MSAVAQHAAPVTLEEVKRRHVEMVLQINAWHQGRSAKVLGISTKTLYRYMRTWNLRRRQS